MKRSHGLRCNSRHKMRVRPRDKGKIPVTKTMADFPIGDRVTIIIEPRIHKGMPHQAFQGRTGLIQGKQGNAFILIIHDGKKEKKLIVRPEHLVRVK